MKSEQMRDWLLRGAFFGGCALLLWVLGRYVILWFLPFVLGFLIAYIMRRPAGFIAKHSGMRPRGASIVSGVLFYLVLGLLLWLLGAYLIGRAQELGQRLPELYETGVKQTLQTISERIGEITGERAFAGPIGASAAGTLDIVNQALGGAAASASQWGIEFLGKLAGKIPMLAIAIIFTIVSSVLICADYEKIRAGAIRMIPHKHRDTVLQTRDYLLKAVGGTLKAYLIIMAITFAVLAPSLWLLGVGSFLAMAALIALLDFLPVIGSGVVLLPWAGYFLLTGATGRGLGMLALWVALSILREVIEPRIVGGQIGLHPLATITAMYAGLKIAGVGGLILAPIACLLVRHLYRQGIFHRLAPEKQQP